MPDEKAVTTPLRYDGIGLTIPDPTVLDPGHPDLESQIAAVPSGSGIYTLAMPDAPPHLSSCAYLRARLRRILTPLTTPGMKQRVRDRLVAVECWPTGSKLESWLLLYSLARRLFPDDYLGKLRLRPPWFVGLSLSDRFPRVTVSNRIAAGADPLYGPFPARDTAQAYAEAVASLFQTRRCTDPLVPAPDHPGCIYGEMSQCLRPCQCAVSDSEYASEAGRVADFLATNGGAMRSSLTLARQRASEAMEFESAAQLHKRLERLAEAAALRDEWVNDARAFSGIALTPSSGGGLRLWPMHNGIWCDSLQVSVDQDPSHARSLDATLRKLLENSFAAPVSLADDRAAHLALFLRWYRSSWRDGQWFPRSTLGDLNYRKLVREISKLTRAQVGPGAQPAS